MCISARPPVEKPSSFGSDPSTDANMPNIRRASIDKSNLGLAEAVQGRNLLGTNGHETRKGSHFL
jgi:hypothetical protein